ncbi:MAG: rod shape-determining protein RodA [Gammaproteobacteria bacterium]|nr:MAG: rod shape-determining protein RodA [Gammaproteobacteria bacterium]
MKNIIKLGMFVALSFVMQAVIAEEAKRSLSIENAQVYIISPKNGATVPTTFKVVFGLSGMGVSPAGYNKKFTGHHHLLIDGKTPDLLKPLGGDVKHFGGGQTEAFVTLPKGKHTLSLILGDYMHRPHNPAVVSEEIVVHVK